MKQISDELLRDTIKLLCDLRGKHISVPRIDFEVPVKSSLAGMISPEKIKINNVLRQLEQIRNEG